MSTDSGTVHIFDLNKKTEKAQLKVSSRKIDHIHITLIGQDELLMVFMKEKNSVHQYVRDDLEQSCFRLLRKREGISQQLQKISAYKDRFLIGLTSSSSEPLFKISIYNDTTTVKFSSKNKAQN